VLGDPEVLGSNPVYKAFMDRYLVAMEAYVAEIRV